MMEDCQDQVVEAIRQALPEFAERNGIRVVDEATTRPTVTTKQLDNLARWVSGVVPPRVYRRGCGIDGVCACTGYCQAWLLVERDPPTVTSILTASTVPCNVRELWLI